ERWASSGLSAKPLVARGSEESTFLFACTDSATELDPARVPGPTVAREVQGPPQVASELSRNSSCSGLFCQRLLRSANVQVQGAMTGSEGIVNRGLEVLVRLVGVGDLLDQPLGQLGHALLELCDGLLEVVDFRLGVGVELIEERGESYLG